MLNLYILTITYFFYFLFYVFYIKKPAYKKRAAFLLYNIQPSLYNLSKV